MKHVPSKGISSVASLTSLKIRRLLAERNMSLTGASLFTSFLIYRIYEMNMDNVQLGEKLAKLEGMDVSLVEQKGIFTAVACGYANLLRYTKTGPSIENDRATFKGHYQDTKVRRLACLSLSRRTDQIKPKLAGPRKSNPRKKYRQQGRARPRSRPDRRASVSCTLWS